MRALLLAGAAAFGWAGAAYASIVTYNVAGAFPGSSNSVTLSGSFTVDNSKSNFSEFSNIDVKVAGFTDFISVQTIGVQPSSPALYELTLKNSTNLTLALVFNALHSYYDLISIPDEALITSADNSLVYTRVGLTIFGSGTSVSLASGTIAAVTSVPEPASLALLGLGVAGIAATRRRRVV